MCCVALCSTSGLRCSAYVLYLSSAQLLIGTLFWVLYYGDRRCGCCFVCSLVFTGTELVEKGKVGNVSESEWIGVYVVVLR